MCTGGRYIKYQYMLIHLEFCVISSPSFQQSSLYRRFFYDDVFNDDVFNNIGNIAIYVTIYEWLHVYVAYGNACNSLPLSFREYLQSRRLSKLNLILSWALTVKGLNRSMFVIRIQIYYCEIIVSIFKRYDCQFSYHFVHLPICFSQISLHSAWRHHICHY